MSTPPVEKLWLKGCGGDGRRESQGGGDDGARGSRVMAGVMLGLGRVGGGSGWRNTRHGTTSFDAPPLVRAATVSRDPDFE